MGALLVVPALVEDLEENLAALAVYSNRDACPVDQAEAPEAAYVAADLVVVLDTVKSKINSQSHDWFYVITIGGPGRGGPCGTGGGGPPGLIWPILGPGPLGLGGPFHWGCP